MEGLLRIKYIEVTKTRLIKILFIIIVTIVQIKENQQNSNVVTCHRLKGIKLTLQQALYDEL